jgi:CRISPR system Cascade subunit CasE
MVRLAVDQRNLFGFAKSRNILLSATDPGYILHCLFTEVFGPGYSPKPFAVQKAAGHLLPVLAYTPFTKEELEEQAKLFCTPEKRALLHWNEFAVKAMPYQWRPESKYAFEVRVCPVERKSNVGQFNRQKGAEMDVYLCHVWKHGKDLDRGTLYERWTKGQIEKPQPDRRFSAKVLEIKTREFGRIKFVRRDRERNAIVKERPEAFLTGILEIADSNSFTEFLRRGIGRHRAFGFGMLLLEPVS